jgi:hypothetical protein
MEEKKIDQIITAQLIDKLGRLERESRNKCPNTQNTRPAKSAQTQDGKSKKS